jgi:Heterokaryon incompatibility protein (HET)
VTKTISVDGSDRDVTANLESALRHIRDPSATRNIWADAVCINQSDNEEKAQQISQMGDVYKLARQTIIYLGESTKESDLFLSYVQSSNSMYNTGETAPTDESNALSHWPSILHCSWFERIWIF